jgi:hypothetical protein
LSDLSEGFGLKRLLKRSFLLQLTRWTNRRGSCLVLLLLLLLVVVLLLLLLVVHHGT